MICDKVFCPNYSVIVDGCINDVCTQETKHKKCPLCGNDIKDFETVCENCEYEND